MQHSNSLLPTKLASQH